MGEPMPAELMTVREVASYLRMKERKVYDLVAKRAIPCSRIGGKWLFPKSLIDGWLMQQVEGPSQGSLVRPPDILAGSHDPLLEWAVRESRSELALLLDGSISGADRVAARGAAACGMHIIDPATGDYNVPYVRSRFAAESLVLVEWARRQQGLIVASGNPKQVAGIEDLPRLRVAVRQREAGSYLLLTYLLERAGLPLSLLLSTKTPLRTETDVALAIADGHADVGLGIAAVAHQLRLDFLPLWTERFDLLVWRRSWFEDPFQRLLAFTGSAAFASRSRELAGYDTARLGTVHWNGP
jgi:putative molybdopterin biosynthesis protein